MGFWWTRNLPCNPPVFLTRQSLYLIVNNTRINPTDFNHWVQTINLFSNNSPIIIIQNEVAGSPVELDLKGLRTQFKNILYVRDADLSNTTDGRLGRLIRDIRHEIQQLKHVGSMLPAKWVVIRKVIEGRAKMEKFISQKELVKICNQNEIHKNDEIIRLSALFHDLGIFLHFQEDELLNKLVILKNSWATKGVYAILDNKKIQQQQHGHFSYQDALEIWNNTEFEGMHDELLKLMKKFELCYQLSYKRKRHYVSPQLLPIEQPDYEWNNEENLIIFYTYEFMPKGLLARLIVRMHQYIKDVNKTAWRTGCVFTYNRTDAQIIETYGVKKIEIRIKGIHSSDFAAIIVKEVDELNRTFPKMILIKKFLVIVHIVKQLKTHIFINIMPLKKELHTTNQQ